MTVTELATLLEAYDREEKIWVVLVEHEDGELELIGFDDRAEAVASCEDAIERFEDPSVLVPHDADVPVSWPCDVVARDTRLELLNACPRCAS